MDEFMLSDLPVEQREQVLHDSCDQIEERSYTRKFDQEEINELRAEHASVSIQIQELNENLAEIKADFKAKITPLTERNGKILDELKVGGEFVKGNSYKFIDTEKGMVGWYSPEGYLLEERKIKREEQQRTVFQMTRKTGTDN